jgi:hypothetical protein
MNNKMMWESAIAEACVDGWTEKEKETLRNALDMLVEATFNAMEAEVLENNPLARMAIE